MPDFAYTALDAAGRQVTGVLAATTTREALATLGDRALYPLKVRERAGDWRQHFRSQRVGAAALATMFGQLADLLASGVPLLRALDVIGRQSTQPRLREVLTDVRQQVADGATLDAALARHPQVFSELIVSLVRAGGEGGFLEDVLQRTATFLEQQEELKGRVISAMVYPLFLVVVGLVATIAILVFLVPMFAGMFKQLDANGGLPLLTRGLFAFSDLLRSAWWLVALVLVGLVVALRRVARDPRVARFMDQARLRLPLIGPVFKSLAVARFCRVLGTMLKNGVPILRALEIASGSTGNRVLSTAVLDATRNISQGQTLAKPLGSSGLFPRDTIEMIAVAEEANNLEHVLLQAADSLERRTARKLDLLVRLIEPLLLMVMAGAILLLVLALLVPVIDASSSMG